jgi:hypothetical protein
MFPVESGATRAARPRRWADAHAAGGYYNNIDRLLAGESTLGELEERAIARALDGRVAARRVLHVQTHLGFGAITLARRGARATGCGGRRAERARRRER